MAEIFAILLIVAVCFALFAGYPVAFTLGGLSFAFAVLGSLLGIFDFGFLAALPQRIFGVMTNGVLIAIPLFIFMGVMLERSRIAEDLLETMGRLFGPLRGGLGISVIVVGVLLAAAKGVVGATTATMGLIVLPAIRRFVFGAA
jgi:TRAP-type mannitol/chloroaromatic compound transport system permease large subunit